MPAIKYETSKLLVFVFIVFVISVAFPDRADSEIQLSAGESIYVPIYSNVFAGPKKLPFQLAAMLSIRNTDPKYTITVVRVDYYGNDGRMLEEYTEKQIELRPFASMHFYVKEYDKRGGPGANFIVKWRSANKVNRPIIQGIMLGLTSGQGLSFICPGQPIEEHDE
jgi:hypothetical protein